MSCPNCKKPIYQNQVICLNCGIQLKTVKSKSFINSLAKFCCCCIVIFA